MNELSWPDELIRVLGRRLAEIRREAGLTQAQLAARLRGTNRGWQQAVSRFEQGKAGQQSLFFILDYLRVCGHLVFGYFWAGFGTLYQEHRDRMRYNRQHKLVFETQ